MVFAGLCVITMCHQSRHMSLEPDHRAKLYKGDCARLSDCSVLTALLG